jgi:hypothetical protein
MAVTAVTSRLIESAHSKVMVFIRVVPTILTMPLVVGPVADEHEEMLQAVVISKDQLIMIVIVMKALVRESLMVNRTETEKASTEVEKAVSNLSSSC